MKNFCKFIEKMNKTILHFTVLSTILSVRVKQRYQQCVNKKVSILGSLHFTYVPTYSFRLFEISRKWWSKKIQGNNKNVTLWLIKLSSLYMWRVNSYMYAGWYTYIIFSLKLEIIAPTLNLVNTKEGLRLKSFLLLETKEKERFHYRDHP